MNDLKNRGFEVHLNAVHALKREAGFMSKGSDDVKDFDSTFYVTKKQKRLNRMAFENIWSVENW
jgi:hypothetical protein